MLTPKVQIQSTVDCKSVLPVDEAVPDFIAALDRECVLAFSSAPSDEESTVHLHIIINICHLISIIQKNVCAEYM